MAGSFEKAITIRQAIRNIDDRSFLLPAIQRNFGQRMSKHQGLAEQTEVTPI